MEHRNMTLHIKDEKADRLARELAQATGETLTEAVTKALEERLQRERGLRDADFEARFRGVMEILREIDKLPVLDVRTPDELLGYDEHGLPT
jgi:antitoxin VapB